MEAGYRVYSDGGGGENNSLTLTLTSIFVASFETIPRLLDLILMHRQALAKLGTLETKMVTR